jgi:putative hydrolase of the HAD superfamily
MRYDAVIFDLFGTLVRTVTPDAYEEMLERLADALGAGRAEFAGSWRETIAERESGTIGDLEGVLRSTAERAGAQTNERTRASAKQAWLDTVRDWLVPRAETVPMLQAFREAGHRVGLLSNCSAEVPPLWQVGPLSGLIEVPVFSCDVRLMKPDARIYAHVCERLGVVPDRCLYVGDGGARELTGAEAVGMHAVLLRVPGEEHTWFDSNYRRDALEWQGDVVGDLAALAAYL